MQITKFSILRAIAFNVQKYKKNYCYMSQSKILEVLKTIYDIDINKRSLNYHLADLRSEGFIISIKRTHRNNNGTLCLLSSATCLTQQACKLLVKFGYQYFRKVFQMLRSKYWPSKDIHKNQNRTDKRFNIDTLSENQKKELLSKFKKAFPKRF